MIPISNCTDKSDAKLVELTLKDQEYFLCLVKKYEAPFFRYLARLSNFDAATIEDILQEIFIKIYKNLNGFDQHLKFSSWAYRIAHNELISYYRKTKARPQSVSANDDDNKLLNKLISAIDIEKDTNNELNAHIINKILLNLDIKYREVLILKYLEDKSYDEIADILKKPSGTVASLINRAKYKFKQEFSKQNIKI